MLIQQHRRQVFDFCTIEPIDIEQCSRVTSYSISHMVYLGNQNYSGEGYTQRRSQSEQFSPIDNCEFTGINSFLMIYLVYILHNNGLPLYSIFLGTQSAID